MKLRSLLVIALVVGLLAVYYFFGTDYLQQRQSKAALASQIVAASQQLALIPLPPADLEQRLASANASLEEERNSFPTRMNSVRLVNDILRLAESAGVKAVPVITQPWTAETVGQAEFAVFRLNVTAGGTLAQLAEFLYRLESGEPGTLVVTSLKVDRATGPPGSENLTGENPEVEASLAIAVYARPPAAAPDNQVAQP